MKNIDLTRRQFITLSGAAGLSTFLLTPNNILAQEISKEKVLLTPEWRIIISTKATAPENFAAEELQHYLNKLIGYHLKIEKSDTIQLQKTFIIGRHPALEKYTQKLDAEYGAKPDSFALVVTSNFVGMVGATQIATCFAVWQWLEELGVRWIFPTPKGEYVPRLTSIEISGGENYFAPDINQRWIWPWATGDQKKPEHFGQLEHGIPAANLYQLRLRAWDSSNPVSPEDRVANVGWGHSYARFLPPDKYFAAHPEWYNLVGGRRRNTVKDGMQVCFTNEEGAKEFAKNVVAEIAQVSRTANFKRYRISVMPNDVRAWCECENCRKLVDKDGSATSMVVHYTNLVAREVAKTYPDYIFYTLAYWNHSTVPDHVKPDPNVGIHITQWPSGDSFLFNNSRPGLTADGNAKFLKGYTEWSAICNNMTIYQYYGHYVWWTPWPMKTQMDFDLKRHARNPIFRGYTSEYHTNWNNQGLGRYLLAKLGWDAQQDVDALQKDYCQAAFGPAAAILGEYYDVLQASMDRAPRIGGNYWVLPEVLTRTTIDRCNELAKQARALLPQMDEGTRWRTDFVLKGWDMSAHMGEAMLLFRKATPNLRNAQAMRTHFQAINDFMATPEGCYLSDSTITTGAYKRYVKDFLLPLEALPAGRHTYADKMNYGGSSKFHAKFSGLKDTEWGYRIVAGGKGTYEIPLKAAPGHSIKALKLTVRSLGAATNLNHTVTVTSDSGTHLFTENPVTGKAVTVPAGILNTPEVRLKIEIENTSNDEQYCLNGLDFEIEVV